MVFHRQKRILIIRQDRIGDVVLSTALPRAIKQQWPDAHVAVLLRSYTRDVYRHNPHVDEILVDEYESTDPRQKRRSFWSLVRQLRQRRFTHALMLLPQARYNYATFLAGIRIRVGVGVILFHLITGTRWVMRYKYRERRHEADYCLDLARKIGVHSTNPAPEIHLSPTEQTQVSRLRQLWGGDKHRLVGIQVTSGGSAPNWPPACYRELVQLLPKLPLPGEGGLQILVTDNEVPTVMADLPGIIYPNRGQDLRTAILNFAALDVLISASTGPMHICAALQIPTVSLFCPETSCAPARWGPLGNQSAVLLPDPDYCQQLCPGDTHICNFTGKGGMKAAQVAAAAMEVLRASPIAP